MNPVRGFSLSYSFKNAAGENWRRYYNYPNYGVTYMYKTYNNPDVLGDSHSITSFLQLSFLPKRRYFDIGFKGLAGFGYFTKQYDPVLNPTNQAISAKFNITAETRLYAKVRVKPVYFEYSFGLNHSSNGLVKSPNLGINVVNNKFTVGIEFEDKIEKNDIIKEDKPLFIKNEFWAYAAAGVKIIELNSEKYIFSVFSVNYSKQISVINKIGFGVDFYNDTSKTPIGKEI
jgi:hypothetical protein